MFIDMHMHSKRSDDAGATVEGYLKWIDVLRKKGYRVDGIVLTEHRGFASEADYSTLAEQYGVVVLKGSEIETTLGHVLVYGVTPKLLDQFDFKNITLPAYDVMRAIKDYGGYAVAAHPGRPRIGLWNHIQGGATVDGIATIERLNGGSNVEENGLAAKLAEEYGFSCVGGSDSHYVNTVGKCITRFDGQISRVEDLVEALYSGEFEAAVLEDTKAP
ncbi:MAG: metal-dependent phosphohydrolase [Dehalococcoidia bacterium]|nr:metal-dependent phosphohydrolase [Dehalococcoidia bacterium]